MASFDDLGRALRDDAAANAPRASAIDVDAVTRAARARRRPRQWAGGTLSVIAVLGFGGLAVAAATPPVMIAASETTDLDAGVAESGSAPLAEGDGERLGSVNLADLVACGADSTSPQADVAGLALELRLAPNAPSDGSPIDATAVLVNTSDEAVTVLTGTSAVAVLTQNGAVVGYERPRDNVALEFVLSPGQSRELPTLISTLDCRNTAQGALAPGSYGVTAVLDVLDPATGARALVVGPSNEIRLD